MPGLSVEDIRIGISQPRNKNLAEVFHRLHLIESYGTGIRRIFRLYEKCALKPSIETTPNAFKIVLPNMNSDDALNEDSSSKSDERISTVTPQMNKVLDYLAEHGEMNEDDLQSLLGVKKTRAYMVARQMKEDGLIDIVGRGGTKKYRTAK